MYSAQNNGLVECLQELLAIERMSPKMFHFLWGRLISSLTIAEAPIVDRLQLTEVSHKNDGQVPKRACARINSLLTEVRALGLLEADMHAVEERATNEGNFIHNQKLNVAPLLL